MFKYTRAVFNDAINDLKKFLHIFSIFTQILYLIYLVYAVLTDKGVFYANVVLLGISVVYFIIYILTYGKKPKKLKTVAYVAKHAKTITKLLITAFTLGVAIYGIYTSAKNVDAISIVLTTLMIVFWCLQALLEIVLFFLEHKKNMIFAGLKKDCEPYVTKLDKVGNTFRRLTGKEEVVREPLPSKVNEYLEKTLKKYGTEKDIKKAEKEKASALKRQAKTDGDKPNKSVVDK